MSDMPSVTLRPSAAEDLDVLFRLAGDLSTWEERSASPPAPLTRDAFEARLVRGAQDDASAQGVRFVVDVGGVAVGTVSLFEVDELARHAEIGIALLLEARGRGIGTMAISQIVDFGFVRRNLRRLHLQAIASNVPAIRAYQRAGFVIEGHQRQHAWVRGAYEDIVLMGLLRAEWRAAAEPLPSVAVTTNSALPAADSA